MKQHHSPRWLPTLLVILVLLGFLFCVPWIFFSQSSPRPAPEPSLALDTLQEVELVPGERTTNIRIGDTVYEAYCTAAPLYPDEYTQEAYAQVETPAGTGQGRVLAYKLQGGGRDYAYYAEITGLASDQWLLCFSDDGTGRAGSDNLLGIYKSVDVTDVPDWLAQIRDIQYAQPSSDSDI